MPAEPPEISNLQLEDEPTRVIYCNGHAVLLTPVSKDGDIVIEVRDPSTLQFSFFQVDSQCLSRVSPYFETLFHPTKFHEGATLSEARLHLHESHKNSERAAVESLPRVTLEELGHLTSTRPSDRVVADFLRLLHGYDLPDLPKEISALKYAATLLILADRFQTISTVAPHVQHGKLAQALDRKLKASKTLQFNEERERQKLLIGLMIGHFPLVQRSSKALIINGSTMWDPEEEEEQDGEEDVDMWWDLPNGLETELRYRRECILRTLNSIQTYFLKQFTSKQRQCRLGYDSSAQCDSFQLGEMVRFFVRIGTLRLQGNIYDHGEGADAHPGNLDRLLESLRQCPSYQIDRNHSHCGLRTLILPILSYLELWISLEAQICARCWKDDRANYSWLSAPPSRTYKFQVSAPRGSRKNKSATSRTPCGTDHGVAKHIFTAETHEWKPDA
ncbi:hypothetical protein L228DRAFT_236919 [Xylona heveae TC161]|uniref:BTB domain-containing protein n=1 Tax=Xylona heveae (strain CBS 132557 / TC161) TaxID=1328760 RepID=A0A161TDK0_XYLHT|nr:hypothetical protein L228DRAFT_236919 [Xylona heveae TC161]KZF23937.1 hypothetical protein L228DRAFT_236919 [Xylona heveae TC161]